MNFIPSAQSADTPQILKVALEQVFLQGQNLNTYQKR